MSKNFDETVCLQSEKKEEWIQELISRIVLREKRVSGDPLKPDRTGGERRQFLLVIKVKGKMKERTEWRG